MKKEEMNKIREGIYKRDAYSEDAQQLLIEYLEENYDIVDDMEEVSACDILCFYGNQNFIYFKEAEDYLKKYHCGGYFLQSIVEMINDVYECYDIRITNICELADLKLEEELSMLITELY